MDARERMIRALAHKEGDLPDRVPIFVEGMMRHFVEKTAKKFKDEFPLKDRVLNKLNLNRRDFKWPLFYKFDSFWLHSTPVRMKPMPRIVAKANIGKKKEKITRWGHVHTLTFNRETGPAAGYSDPGPVGGERCAAPDLMPNKPVVGFHAEAPEALHAKNPCAVVWLPDDGVLLEDLYLYASSGELPGCDEARGSRAYDGGFGPQPRPLRSAL